MNLLDLFEARYKSIPAIAELHTAVERNKPVSHKIFELSVREADMVRNFLVSKYGDGDPGFPNSLHEEEVWEILTSNVRFFVSLISFNEQDVAKYQVPYIMEFWSSDTPAWDSSRRTRLKKKAKKKAKKKK